MKISVSQVYSTHVFGFYVIPRFLSAVPHVIIDEQELNGIIQHIVPFRVFQE